MFYNVKHAVKGNRAWFLVWLDETWPVPQIMVGSLVRRFRVPFSRVLTDPPPPPLTSFPFLPLYRNLELSLLLPIPDSPLHVPEVHHRDRSVQESDLTTN